MLSNIESRVKLFKQHSCYMIINVPSFINGNAFTLSVHVVDIILLDSRINTFRFSFYLNWFIHILSLLLHSYFVTEMQFGNKSKRKYIMSLEKTYERYQNCMYHIEFCDIISNCFR